MAKKLRCAECNKKIGHGVTYYKADSDRIQYHIDCLAMAFKRTAEGITIGLYSEIHDNFQRKTNYSASN